VTASRVLVALALYVAALDLAAGWGLVRALATPPALALVGVAGVLLALSAIRAARAPAPPALRAARALLRLGAALAVLGLPASLFARDARAVSAGEGEEIPPQTGLPALRFGEVTLAPRGPHVLSKTVEIEALADGEEPVRIGLFPPTAFAGGRASVLRFGYAPGFALRAADGTEIASGRVKLGTLPQTAEEASLVSWTPETNLMMGAGTFPPRLEDLVSPARSDVHVFLRMVEAKLGGVPRDLGDPDAHRWMLDGRPEDAVFLVQVFRGRERVFDGRVRAGGAIAFPGGTLAIAPDVLLWVDLLLVRDPWLLVAACGLALLAAGALLRAGIALARGRPRPLPT
jgi:hypothetical protein